MSLLNHTPTLILPRDVSKNYKVIEDSQETALYLTVNTQDRNRDCLYAVAECYPALRKLFSISAFNQVSIGSELLKELLAKPDLFENKESGASFFRDSAIKVEIANIHLALQLMKLARKYRPKGPLIIKKIKEYQAKIKNS